PGPGLPRPGRPRPGRGTVAAPPRGLARVSAGLARPRRGATGQEGAPGGTGLSGRGALVAGPRYRTAPEPRPPRPPLAPWAGDARSEPRVGPDGLPVAGGILPRADPLP